MLECLFEMETILYNLLQLRALVALVMLGRAAAHLGSVCCSNLGRMWRVNVDHVAKLIGVSHTHMRRNEFFLPANLSSGGA